MKTKKVFKVVREWPLKPKTWGVVYVTKDRWYIFGIQKREFAYLIANRMQDAFELGKETEWKESQAKAEKLMDKFGI